MLARPHQTVLEFVGGFYAQGPGSEAGRVTGKINLDRVAMIISVLAIAVFGTQPLVAATATEATDAGETVVVEKDDVELVALL